MSKRVFISVRSDRSRRLRHQRREKKKNIIAKRRRIAIITVLLIVICALTGLILTNIGYNVIIDGQKAGTVRSGEEVAAIIRQVEADVSDLLGYDYDVDAAVRLDVTVGGEKGDIADAFMQTVEEIDLMYVLRVDGFFAACAWTEEEITAAVDEITARYAMGEDCTVSFDNVITVTNTYAPVARVTTTEDITELLDPANGGKFALRVRTVFHETHTEPIAFEYEYIEDDTVYEGEETVLSVGAEGSADVTERIEYINGEEVSRVEVSNILTREPVNHVVSTGTMFRPAWVSYGEYIWPAEGIISSYFGPRSIFYGDSDHEGLDIANYRDTPIVAADGGEVIYSDEYYGYGLMIEIQHDNGEVTRYAHCNELVVEVGQKVARGELIAYMGSTGVSSGDHVHFEIKVNGEPIDPLTRLPERE